MLSKIFDLQRQAIGNFDLTVITLESPRGSEIKPSGAH